MVRLKVFIAIILFENIIVFQFLMVRLKVANLLSANQTNDLISIPYGSIKSRKSPTFVDRWTTFQFLMVRLKAVANDNIPTLYISLLALLNSGAKLIKSRQSAII